MAQSRLARLRLMNKSESYKWQFTIRAKIKKEFERSSNDENYRRREKPFLGTIFKALLSGCESPTAYIVYINTKQMKSAIKN